MDVNPEALRGIRVVDLSPFMPGHYASTILGDLGATVVQIEPPGGLPARELPGLFYSTCRNRQSVVLNLKAGTGQEIFHRLAATSDVVIEGFRPGVAARLGVDYDSLRAHNPALIYCSMSGFGQEGPLRDWMGHDCNYVAFAGGLAVFGEPTARDRLEPFGLPVADLTASLHAVVGVLAALLERQGDGQGQYLDVAIADGPLSFVVPRLAEYLLTARRPQRGLARGVFRTRDGGYLTTGVVEDHAWRALCESVERRDLIDEPRFRTFADRNAHAEDLEALFAEIFGQRTLAEWEQVLDARRYAWAPVRGMVDAFAEPQVAARGLVTSMDVRGIGIPVMGLPVKRKRGPSRPMPSPRAGEHTQTVLRELGYSGAAINDLASRGVVGI